MPKFSSIEKQEANNHLNMITGYNPHSCPAPMALFNYEELIQKVESGKRFRMFTNNVTSFPHPFFPNLYITKLGDLVFRIIRDNLENPYTTGKFQHVLIHPKIALISQLMIRYSPFSYHFWNYQQIENTCETCFADFKVRIQTRDFDTKHKSWINKYRTCNDTYDRFMNFIYEESSRFEVHSLVVQRKRINGLELTFNDPGFCNRSAFEIVKEKADEIIQDTWRNRKKNNVLGILSVEEINLQHSCSIRLVFFVRKDFSDLIPFRETALYKNLEKYLIDFNLDYISLGQIYTMNSGIAPLFQGQEQNYYDLNQLHIGNRLNILKYQLVVPNHWFRINDYSCSLTVERGRRDYAR
ncbi:hypothetical protein [Acinetobacter baylyi]|uniref:hypothetical protein n=1 Tax=Acinetobacter baylyi TaxID=202950 RepID=UPI0002D8199F|nr:hypothetical protein [Acinetobacter baylyi]